MFVDPQYSCVTTTEVLKELKSNQKFKTKYPWLKELLPQIVCLPNSELHTVEYESILETINLILGSYPVNPNTNSVFDLSPVDRHIIACAAAHGHVITTGEKDIIDFAGQEFNVTSFSALKVLNDWIEKGLVKCDAYLLSIIDDWEISGEAYQPSDEAGRFQVLTKSFYRGPMRIKKTRKKMMKKSS